MVAREGIAPSTSLCRRDMILFHHRAEIGCRGWNRTSIRAFKGRCPTIRRPGNELVEPEVVATSPYRIKSPVPVCCGFDSLKLVGERGLAPPEAHRLSISGVCCSPVNHTPVGDPGLAPGRLGDFKSPGSAIPAEASRREMVGMKGIAPPRLPDSESGPSAIRVKPHAHCKWHSRQESHLQPGGSKPPALIV